MILLPFIIALFLTITKSHGADVHSSSTVTAHVTATVDPHSYITTITRTRTEVYTRTKHIRSLETSTSVSYDRKRLAPEEPAENDNIEVYTKRFLGWLTDKGKKAQDEATKAVTTATDDAKTLAEAGKHLPRNDPQSVRDLQNDEDHPVRTSPGSSYGRRSEWKREPRRQKQRRDTDEEIADNIRLHASLNSLYGAGPSRAPRSESSQEVGDNAPEEHGDEHEKRFDIPDYYNLPPEEQAEYDEWYRHQRPGRRASSERSVEGTPEQEQSGEKAAQDDEQLGYGRYKREVAPLRKGHASHKRT